LHTLVAGITDGAQPAIGRLLQPFQSEPVHVRQQTRSLLHAVTG
jgi:hypothetical protein